MSPDSKKRADQSQSADAVLSIAETEVDETSQSIANLDNLGDTAIVGITFLLAALGTWVTFVFPRISGFPLIQLSFGLVAGVSVFATIFSVYYLVDSLTPRQFYGANVGNRFLKYKWIPWRNDDHADLERFNREGDIESPDDLRDAVEDWISRYDADTAINSHETFVYSQLLNYKIVARHKARNTAYGMLFLRLAVVSLGLLVLYGIVALLLL